jgi:CheY-like chemotaxis protein
MKLATQLATAGVINKPAPINQVVQCCGLAKELEKAGEYEAACETLVVFWPDRLGAPSVKDLSEEDKAEVLLRVGVLAGWLGSTHGSGAQEQAKNLLTQSLELFQRQQQLNRVAEVQSELALCYWREGGFNEARANLTQALGRITNQDCDLKAAILIRASQVERKAGCLNDAMRQLETSAPLVERSLDPALRGTFHNTRAAVLEELADKDNRDDYLDRALVEYTAASVNFEEAGHVRFQARVENNLGYLYQSIGRFPEAYEHINRARDIFLSLGDEGHVAQVNDTRARALIAEGRYNEAERYARSAVKTLGRGDECSLLVEALTTHGTALARLGRFAAARAEFDRAIAAGENCGDLEGAGRARLAILEELSNQTTASEMAAIYRSAFEILRNSQDPSATRRLLVATTTVINAFAATQPQTAPDLKTWEGFSLRKELRAIEKDLLERALRDAGGSVSIASRLLGFKHHQSLISLINTRHKELLKARSAVRRRRRPMMMKPKPRKLTTLGAKPEARQVSVLHVDDNRDVADVVKDLLRAKEMDVDWCGNGFTALKILTGDARFDAIIVDNDLPGLNGVELVRRVRKITHRRKTPIIMLSEDDVETEAWRAGVKEFLRKPQDIERVSSTVMRLVSA